MILPVSIAAHAVNFTVPGVARVCYVNSFQGNPFAFKP